MSKVINRKEILGRITAIRRDLSNNNRLAEILVSSKLHTKIRYQSNDLSQQIQSYLTKFQDRKQNIDAPKIFADVFEALIAGLFSIRIILSKFSGKLSNHSSVDISIEQYVRFEFDN